MNVEQLGLYIYIYIGEELDVQSNQQNYIYYIEYLVVRQK
jgi:hypothetical protein